MKSQPNLSFCCRYSKEPKINTATEYPWAVTDIHLRGKTYAMVTISDPMFLKPTLIPPYLNTNKTQTHSLFSWDKSNSREKNIWFSFRFQILNGLNTHSIDLSKVSPLTCWFLKSSDSILESSLCLSVGTSADLWVESCHVEDHTGFLQRDVLLAYRHTSEGVIPTHTHKHF